MKSLLSKSVINISIWLMELYGNYTSLWNYTDTNKKSVKCENFVQILQRSMVRNKIHTKMQFTVIERVNLWIFTFNFLFYKPLYNFFSPSYSTLKQKDSFLFQCWITWWKKIVQRSIKKQLKIKIQFFESCAQFLIDVVKLRKFLKKFWEFMHLHLCVCDFTLYYQYDRFLKYRSGK